MDNFGIDVVSQGREIFDKVMGIAFRGSGLNKGAVGIRMDDNKGMIFLWAMPGKPGPTDVAFPFKMDAAGAANFAALWLEQAVYPPEPDHDGDNRKGWRVYNHNTGHDYTICAVQPAWALIGK